jgi:serine/threonine protein kinase
VDNDRVPPLSSDRPAAAGTQAGAAAASGAMNWDELETLMRSELAPGLELIRPLGRGERAGVYLAREGALKRLVAVKVLSPDIARDPTARLRFEREAQAIASVLHPNVIAVFRVDRLSNDVPFLVMQYVKGRSLADVLEAEGQMEMGVARKVIADLAAALSATHKKGIVHRNVKPTNVLVEEDSGRAILTDFGFAAILTTGDEKPLQLTRAGEVIGDLGYMSPEQMTHRSLTELSDIYSLGVLGYELLTLRKPFEGIAMVRHATAPTEPPRISQVRSDVDPTVETILRRCLSSNPAHRPSAADIVRQLAAPPGQPGAGPSNAALAKPPAPKTPPARKPTRKRDRLDVFISYHSSDEKYAENLYEYLCSHGIEAFFSKRSLPEMSESDYISAIHDALEQATHIVVVASSALCAQGGWVRSEWSLWYNEKLSGRKNGNVITVRTNAFPIHELPIALRANQVVDLNAEGYEQLLRYLTNRIEEDSEKPGKAESTD